MTPRRTRPASRFTAVAATAAPPPARQPWPSQNLRRRSRCPSLRRRRPPRPRNSRALHAIDAVGPPARRRRRPPRRRRRPCGPCASSSEKGEGGGYMIQVGAYKSHALAQGAGRQAGLHRRRGRQGRGSRRQLSRPLPRPQPAAGQGDVPYPLSQGAGLQWWRSLRGAPPLLPTSRSDHPGERPDPD